MPARSSFSRIHVALHEVLALQNIAYANIYLSMGVSLPLYQEEITLGQEFLTKAIELKPSLITGKPCELLKSWVSWAAHDAEHFGCGHEKIIGSIFNNLPPLLQESEKRTYGQLLKAIYGKDYMR